MVKFFVINKISFSSFSIIMEMTGFELKVFIGFFTVIDISMTVIKQEFDPFGHITNPRQHFLML